jgi:hypothetical protein
MNCGGGKRASRWDGRDERTPWISATSPNGVEAALTRLAHVPGLPMERRQDDVPICQRFP